jgi:hypothetical protein
MIIEFEPQLNPYKDVIDIVNCFKTPPDFFYWLAQNEIHYVPLTRTDVYNVREAVFEIKLNGQTLCAIGGNLDTNTLPEPFRTRFKNETNLNLFVCPEMKTFRHKIISHSVENSNYSIFCEVYYEDICCGSGWELFYLENIKAAFNTRKQILNFEQIQKVSSV